ncbi:MAG: GAF domain-containing protein [Pseudomonadota bacterium]
MKKTDDTEETRLSALKRLMVMDSPEEQAYNDITRLAASICDTPIALISLVDDKRQWFKAKVGLAVQQTPRDMAFCAYTIPDPDHVLVVEDTHLDARFAGNPLVTGDPNIRFYAGAPLVTEDRQVLGTVCVIDRVPRTLDVQQLDTLKFMAAQVMTMLEVQPDAAQSLLGKAVDKNSSASLERLRKAVADERASSRSSESDTMRLLVQRMRNYEDGAGIAPSMSEFMEWRNTIEMRDAKAHFTKARRG